MKRMKFRAFFLLCPFNIWYNTRVKSDCECHRLLDSWMLLLFTQICFVYSFFDPLNEKFFINNNRNKNETFLQVNKCFTRTSFRCIDVDNNNNSSCLVFGLRLNCYYFFVLANGTICIILFVCHSHPIHSSISGTESKWERF